MTEPNINLIQCGDHQLAPWSIVCEHLMNGASREWMSMPSNNPEVDYDWVCPDCIPTEENPPNIDNLRAICIHCVRHLRSKFDPNFKSE